MNVESIPKFTDPAAKLWATIPTETKKLLLANVWCGTCRHEVTITNFTGAVKAGDLLVVGLCSECRGDVARVIEMEWHQVEGSAPFRIIKSKNSVNPSRAVCPCLAASKSWELS